jgi:hypothetical protein
LKIEKLFHVVQALKNSNNFQAAVSEKMQASRKKVFSN